MKKKSLKRLVSNISVEYASETMLYGDMKFKIVAENGNDYSRLNVYVYTKEGTLSLVATCGDIELYCPVKYYDDDRRRTRGNVCNLEAAEEYIQKVY